MDRFITRKPGSKTLSGATSTTCLSASDVRQSGDISIESAVEPIAHTSASDGDEKLTSLSSQNPWPYIQDFYEFMS